MARVVHVTEQDIKQFSHLKEPGGNYRRFNHEVNRRAILLAMKREIGDESTDASFTYPAEGYAIVNYNVWVRKPYGCIRVNIPVTWHMRRLQPFSFVLPRFPARITKHG